MNSIGLPAGMREITLRAYTNGFAVVIPEQEGLWSDAECENNDRHFHKCERNSCEFWAELCLASHIIGSFRVPSPPRRVRMLETVRPDAPVAFVEECRRAHIALKGQIYETSVNPNGAVSAFIDGRPLGLRPGEFEAVPDGDPGP